MTNISFFFKVQHCLVVLLAILLLQACGGERTEPYNPSSSSSSSSAVSVATQIVTQGTDTSSVITHDDKRLQVMRIENEFYDISDAYVNFNLEAQNFTDGQVVLLDLGKQDTCKQHLEFNAIRAQKAGENSVKVVVTYREKVAVSGVCSSVMSRPFYLYYVQSRGTLLFEESIL